MSVSSSTIIELRQAQATSVKQLPNGLDQNGVWKSTIDRAIQINDGDEITIKAVYLDTSASSSGEIHVQEDIPASITCAMYLQNYNLDQQYQWQKQPNPPANTQLRRYPQHDTNALVDGAFRGDNQLWWLAQANEAVGGTNWAIDGVNIKPIIKSDALGYYGGTTLNWEYTPLTPGALPYSAVAQTPMGGVQHRKYKWQELNNEKKWHLNVQCKGSATAPELRLVPSDTGITKASQIESVDFKPYQNTINNTEKYYTLQQFTFPFTIPRGNYTPSELTQLINNLVSNAEASGQASDEYGSQMNLPNAKFPVMSPFMTTILKNYEELQVIGAAQEPVVQIDQAFVGASGQTGTKTITPFTKFDVNGTHYFEYPIATMLDEYDNVPRRPPLDRWVGTNQLDFQLDPQENKIKIDTAHFPIYGNSTSDTSVSPPKIVYDAVPCVAYNDGATDPPLSSIEPAVFVANTGLPLRYSGIGILAMSPTSFWYDSLGFGDSIIKPVYNAKIIAPRADPAVPSPVPTDFNSFTIEAIDGVNVTGAYPGLDIGVQHHEDYYQQPIYNNFQGVGGDTFISTSDTTSLFASRVYNTAIADEGFFKIKIGNNIQQNLVGGRLNTSRDTQSIVNRYYTANSFTSDQGAGSLIYQHSGAPMMLSDFNIEITNPDNTFVDSHILQNKNCIFLEVTKGTPPEIQQNIDNNLKENEPELIVN